MPPPDLERLPPAQAKIWEGFNPARIGEAWCLKGAVATAAAKGWDSAAARAAKSEQAGIERAFEAAANATAAMAEAEDDALLGLLSTAEQALHALVRHVEALEPPSALPVATPPPPAPPVTTPPPLSTSYPSSSSSAGCLLGASPRPPQPGVAPGKRPACPPRDGDLVVDLSGSPPPSPKPAVPRVATNPGAGDTDYALSRWSKPFVSEAESDQMFLAWYDFQVVTLKHSSLEPTALLERIVADAPFPAGEFAGFSVVQQSCGAGSKFGLRFAGDLAVFGSFWCVSCTSVSPPSTEVSATPSPRVLRYVLEMTIVCQKLKIGAVRYSCPFDWTDEQRRGLLALSLSAARVATESGLFLATAVSDLHDYKAAGLAGRLEERLREQLRDASAKPFHATQAFVAPGPRKTHSVRSKLQEAWQGLAAAARRAGFRMPTLDLGDDLGWSFPAVCFNAYMGGASELHTFVFQNPSDAMPCKRAGAGTTLGNRVVAALTGHFEHRAKKPRRC